MTDASAPPAPDPPSVMTKPPADMGPDDIMELQHQIARLTQHNQYLSSRLDSAVVGVQSDAMQAFKEGRHEVEQNFRATHYKMIATYQHHLHLEAQKVIVLQQQLYRATQEIYGYRQYIEQRLGTSTFQNINLATKRPHTLSTPQVADANKRRRLNTDEKYSTATLTASSPHFTQSVVNSETANDVAATNSTAMQNNRSPASRPMKVPVSQLGAARNAALLLQQQQHHQMQRQQLMPGSSSPQLHNGQSQSQPRYEAVQQMPGVLSQQFPRQPQQNISQNMGPPQDMQRLAQVQGMLRAKQMGHSNYNNAHRFRPQMQPAPQAGMNGAQMAQVNNVQVMFRNSSMPNVGQFQSNSVPQAFYGNIMQRQQATQQNLAQMQGHHNFQPQMSMNDIPNMQQAPVLPSSQPAQQKAVHMRIVQPPKKGAPTSRRAQVQTGRIERTHPNYRTARQSQSRMGGSCGSQSRVPMTDISNVQQQAASTTTPQMGIVKEVPRNGTSDSPVDLVSPILHPTTETIGWASTMRAETTNIPAVQLMSQNLGWPSPEIVQGEEVPAIQSVTQNMGWPSPESDEVPTTQPTPEPLGWASPGATEVADVPAIQFQPQSMGWTSPAYSTNQITDESAVTFPRVPSRTPSTNVEQTENGDQNDQTISQDGPETTVAGEHDDSFSNNHYANYAPASTIVPQNVPSPMENLFGDESDYIGDDALTTMLHRELISVRLDNPGEHACPINISNDACIDPALLELSSSTANNISENFEPQHGNSNAPLASNKGQVYAVQNSLNGSQAIPESSSNDANIGTPRKIVCIHCHTHWWEGTCDLGQPCQNCLGHTDCVRPKCPDDVVGTCKKGDQCKMVHRSDAYYEDPYLVDVQKLPKRQGKKADAKTAPSVLAKRKLQEYGLA